MSFFTFQLFSIPGIPDWIINVAIPALIISRFVEPTYDFIVDALKNNPGTIGKIYNAYTRSIGRIIFLKKNRRQKPLEKTGYEYKICKIDGKIRAHKSRIIRLDQTFLFKRIQGEITRVSGPNKSFTSYFKGFLKNEMKYLIWEETYKNEQGSFHLTSHFKMPENNSKDIPGITIEEKDGKVIHSFTILSFTGSAYPSVRKLLRDKKFYTEYTSQLNFDFDSIEAGSIENNFISV